jgi:hypothetical protein
MAFRIKVMISLPNMINLSIVHYLNVDINSYYTQVLTLPLVVASYIIMTS